jgi:fructose-bisphosphate aldolase class II
MEEIDLENIALGPGWPLMHAAEWSSLRGRPAAIGAFNVNFYSQAEGILEGLRRAGAPGILQASRGANKFQGGPDKIAQMVVDAVQNTGHTLPVCLHLDHGDGPAARECIGTGFGSVMLDVSKLEYDANITATRAIVEMAHPKGISVEAELGKLAGVEEDVQSEKTTYADPFLVPNFFAKSGADSLAIAYGTSHGPNKGAGLEKLAVHIVDRCYRAMTAYEQNLGHFLVSHGSSTVPPDLINEINSYGGQMKDARGIPMDRIQAAIAAGIRKVNIDTDLRLGITATFRRYFAERPGIERSSPDLSGIKQVLDANPTVMDPRDYFGHIDKARLRRDPKGTALEEVMGLVKERLASHVEHLCRAFGSAGLAGEVKGHSPDEMKRFYAK